MESHQIKAARESIVSNLILYYNAVKGTDLPKTALDTREDFGQALDDLIEIMEVDPSTWASVKETMFYDEYLKEREEAGTITGIDLVRPGMIQSQFADSAEYYKHCVRVAESRSADGSNLEDRTKVCAVCLKEKHISKFKKRGGSCCTACNSKKYRERKNEA